MRAIEREQIATLALPTAERIGPYLLDPILAVASLSGAMGPVILRVNKKPTTRATPMANASKAIDRTMEA
jgi:hypothetical protein